ncbi:MAG TPA: phage major capsid protein [Trueperaceae bacterium]
MNKEALEAIQNEIKGIEKNLMPLLEKQGEEIKRHGETAAQTSKAIKELEAKYDARMKDLDEALTEIKQDVATKTALKAGRGAGPASVGAAFIDSDEFKAATESQPETGAVQVKSFFSGRKTLFTDASLGQVDAHLYEARREPGIVELPTPDLHIRDLLPVTPITEGLVHYIERSNGRWVAEVQESEGALKKEQALAFTVRQAGPVTIAHWLPISKQALRRAPQLRQYIDRELILGVRLAEDEQLLYGDGSAGNLQGLMTNANVQDYNSAGKSQAGDTRIDTIRRAVTMLRLFYYRPTGVVLHPNDWEAIELQKDGEQRYLWVTVTDGGVPRLWRVPVIDTPTIEEDSFLLGDFAMGANLWDLESASVQVGWKNDDFVRNQLAILGEEDVIFTTEHPKAFVKGDFGAVSS